jgi:hypothetical protein
MFIASMRNNHETNQQKGRFGFTLSLGSGAIGRSTQSNRAILHQKTKTY